jgi:hypothetical protein
VQRPSRSPDEREVCIGMLADAAHYMHHAIAPFLGVRGACAA